VDPTDTSGTLSEKLATVGARLLAATVPEWIEGRIEPRQQDDSEATMTKPLQRGDEQLDWIKPAVQLARQVRAMQPSPGTFTVAEDKLLKVLDASVEAIPASAGMKAGTLLVAHGSPIVVTGQDGLRLLVVQPAGKRPMSGEDWLRGAQMPPGTHLGGNE
jgi:methionyl-tRNA formyltransferase